MKNYEKKESSISKMNRWTETHKPLIAVLTISLCAGSMGFFTYRNWQDDLKLQQRLEQESLAELETNIEETKNEVLESLLAKPLSEDILTEIEKSVVEETTKELENTFEKETKTILVENNISAEPVKVADTESTGYDKNGHPYLLAGHNYTFNADGTPVEAPTQKASANNNYNTITNPTTGVMYTYSSISKNWLVNNQAEQGERARQNRDGIKRFDGTTQDDLVAISDEDIKQLAKQMTP